MQKCTCAVVKYRPQSYSSSFSEANDPAAVEHFAWIPGQVIHAASTGVDGEAR